MNNFKNFLKKIAFHLHICKKCSNFVAALVSTNFGRLKITHQKHQKY